MKNSEIFYFDIDGTLLDNDSKKVPESTIESLHKLKEKGYKLAICTGRNFEGAQEANVVDIVDWDGYVLANGSLILDKNQNVIKETTLDADLISRIDEATSGPLILEGDETFSTKEANDAMTEALDHYGFSFVVPTKKHTSEKVYNLISYNFDDIKDPLLSELKERCILVNDVLGNMEIIPGDSGKHYGTRVLNEHLGVERFTGFGDGENDVDFLREATHSVAMGNGVDNVKAVSTFTTKNVDEDGIYHALVHHDVI